MDPALCKAAEEGDVEFLKESVAVQPSEYFLTQSDGKNIFHIAGRNGKVEFLRESMNILPPHIQKELLSQEELFALGYIMLHIAASTTDIILNKCVREMYASLSWDDEGYVKPWLALSGDKETPLIVALRGKETDEKCAMEILLLDPEHVSYTIVDYHGRSPLDYALNKGFMTVAEKILMSPLPPKLHVSCTDFSIIFRLAAYSSVRRLLVECDGWVDTKGNTLLHYALEPWEKNEELALEILSNHPANKCNIRNNKGESPFFLAVRSGCERVVEEIMRIEEPRFHMLRRNDGTTVIHSLFACPEKTGQMLLNKYWWIINLRDGMGKTALDYAIQENALWLVNLLTNPSLIEAQKEDFNWIEACEREESTAVLAYIDNCLDLQRVYGEQNDTPLHHIRLSTYRDYVNFLKKPSVAELKNTTDHDGATALHRALERKDMHFAKALLLDDGVERIIKDHAGTTAMDLLAKLCKRNDDWEKMCKQIKVNPYLRTTYIQPGTNLEQMRNTLSVIAALLATITFAAGFTLPGGINSDNGQAVLGKKAAFLVFLLADVYAMCTSMLVLFCLVWSMVSVPDMARLLVDRSVFILMQSLYATLLAFMTGIYTVIEHSSLWAAIVIFVMCSFIAILANRTILHKVIAFIVPAANTEKQDRMRSLEEGNGGTSTTEKDISGKTE